VASPGSRPRQVPNDTPMPASWRLHGRQRSRQSTIPELNATRRPSTSRIGHPERQSRSKLAHVPIAGRSKRTFFGPSTPDGACASRNPPAESAGPRLGAGFPAAARGARGRSPLRWITLKTYQGESRMLDSPEGVCAGEVGFEYLATSVPFSNLRVRRSLGKSLENPSTCRREDLE
jgi:hypothetical protein